MRKSPNSFPNVSHEVPLDTTQDVKCIPHSILQMMNVHMHYLYPIKPQKCLLVLSNFTFIDEWYFLWFSGAQVNTIRSRCCA